MEVKIVKSMDEIDKLKAQIKKKDHRIKKLTHLLNEALSDINKLSKEKVELTAKLSKYDNLERYKEYCKGNVFNDDILWVTMQYPEYFNIKFFKKFGII